MKADDAAADALLGKKERDYLKDSNVVEACRKDRGNLAGGIAYAVHWVIHTEPSTSIRVIHIRTMIHPTIQSDTTTNFMMNIL